MRIAEPVQDRNSGKLVLILASLFLLGLAPISATAQTIDLNFNFRAGDRGWTAGFVGYRPVDNTTGAYQLDSGIRYAPRKLTHVPVRAFYIRGSSISAGLIMFLKRGLTPADGIVAGRTYRIEYVLTFASRAASGCVGAGSPPGEGVFLRAGGSSVEPVPVLQPDGVLGLNIDLATATTAAGNIANGLDCEAAYPYFPFVSLQRPVVHTTEVTANSNGELWLFVGTGSGFQGLTGLYYQNVSVRLIPV